VAWVFITLLLHGDLPDQTTAIALEHIAGRPEWRALKLALIASVLCWIGAFTALAGSLPPRLSNLLGRWAVSISIVGAANVVVEYAIIGHALKDVADAWLAAPATEAEVHLRTADVMLAVTGTGYPRWLGWVAVVAGSGRIHCCMGDS
jgi:hypothetical protein